MSNLLEGSEGMHGGCTDVTPIITYKTSRISLSCFLCSRYKVYKFLKDTKKKQQLKF